MSGTASPPLPPIPPEAAAAPLTPEQRKAYAEIGAALEAGYRRIDAMIANMHNPDTSDIDPELLALAARAVEMKKEQPK